ncbi:hypothetical protein [Fodinibius sp. Rm-B-1B1-1]|uniref:hypothetical protein n=1 Tax=Fodinibius alkaliphilus TaxID=3140241 RepID=UPI003159FEDC
MNIRSVLTYSFLIFAGFLLLTGCSKSDDQREFENGAFATPSGITETNSSGDMIGNVDQSDWKISPMYSGLIEIDSELTSPPHPNPLPYNSTLTIQIYFRSQDPVDELIVRKFRLPSDDRYPQIGYRDQSDLNSSMNTIPIDGNQIAENSSDDARTLYRILIYDGKQNLISYGDIEIQ